ncbi:hypothetical protein [Elongatibacter sediminis]|uniref:TIGR03067 domain-containing protein n=1 Tax=Elongatibacter sediminis TaxID=3119006 RepID=A0AAW9RKA5_9GAMM
MIRTLLLLALLQIPAFCWASSNLTEADLLGEWKTISPTAEIEKATLLVNKSGQFSISLSISREVAHLCITATDSIKNDEGIFIFNCDSEDTIGVKLVLAGWKAGGEKALFGTVYLYENGQLVSGLPVSLHQFEPTDNKAFKFVPPASWLHRTTLRVAA